MSVFFIAALCGQQCGKAVVVQRQAVVHNGYAGYGAYAHQTYDYGHEYHRPYLSYTLTDNSDVDALKDALASERAVNAEKTKLIDQQNRFIELQATGADPDDTPEPADPPPAPAKAKAAPKKTKRLTPEQLIVKHCGGCHNANAPNASSFRIGSTWSRVAKAAVYAAVTDKDASTAMPKGKTMPDADRAAIIQWATPCDESQATKASTKKG